MMIDEKYLELEKIQKEREMINTLVERIKTYRLVVTEEQQIKEYEEYLKNR